ncbi:uncharacterized protein BDW70DRAFT_154769 [Aspergillus foveolatus]|uniref:uncharacterized protein n=1 Tax=Aspergillus foveolatus TaxID=210207 RepID=UPI003CCDAB0F
MEGPLRPLTEPASRFSDRAFPLDDTDINCISDEAIIDLHKSARNLHDLGQTTVGGGNVLPCEAEVLQLVASKSNIRAPRVHRSLYFMDDTKYFGTIGYIVMDYIDGKPLDGCWTVLSNEQKMDVARQAAHMIIEMQSIKLFKPAPIGGGPCRGRFFTHYSAGPFKDAAEFGGWFNYKMDICKTYKRAYAGLCPPAFETAALRSQSQFVDFNDMVLSLLTQYPLEEQQLHSIGGLWPAEKSRAVGERELSWTKLFAKPHLPYERFYREIYKSRSLT